MKHIVRFNVFETNSSNTHTLVICPKHLMKEWENSEKYLYKGKLYTKDEILKVLKFDSKLYGRDDISEMLSWYDAWAYNKWDRYGREYLDQSEEEFTTENGDEIVILCKYGYDG